MGLAAQDVVLSEAAAAALADLESSTDPKAKATARRVRALRPILLSDCLHGEVVRPSKIPKALATRYPLGNLYVEDLPSFWRLLYTISQAGNERHVVVVEIVDHRQYDKWFPNRGR